MVICALCNFSERLPRCLTVLPVFHILVHPPYPPIGHEEANTLRHFQADIPQIIRSPSLSNKIESWLQSCPSDAYVLVSQAGATAADYDNRDSVPQMQARIQGKEGKIGSRIAVKDVLGDMGLQNLSRLLQDRCDAGITRVDASSK